MSSMISSHKINTINYKLALVLWRLKIIPVDDYGMDEIFEEFFNNLNDYWEIEIDFNRLVDEDGCFR